jgi:hypothetical protein
MFKWLINFLKKIGILKVQKASYKGDLKDRPVEMIDDI